MHAHSVALIGANSRIGPAILNALLNSPAHFHITILLRPTSKPVSPHPRIRTVVVPSDPPTAFDLTHALSDIDSLVSALNPAELDTQRRLADACVAAGVGRYIPADYGSVRSDDPVVLDLLPNFRNKQLVREHCQRLAEENPGTFTWTSVITGHFFDYGLRTELLGFDLDNGTVLLFDGGKDKWSTSTVAQIGRAVAAVLEREDESTANRILLVQSFCVTQLEVLHAIESVKGVTKLKRMEIGSREYVKEKSQEADKGNTEAVEELVGVLGIKRANWDGEEEYANELLGLKEESLRDIVSGVLAGMER